MLMSDKKCDDRRMIIYIKGKLIAKKCTGVTFYGEITEMDCEYIVNCKILSTINSCCIPMSNNRIAFCFLRIMPKEEIMKCLNLNEWGECKNLVGGQETA